MKKLITMIMILTMCGLCLAACGQAAGGTAGLPESGTEPSGTLSDSPPTLTVTCGDFSIEALKGGYHWMSYEDGEMGSAVIADCAHPLQCKDITPVLIAHGGGNATLTFGEAPYPDKLTVVRYDGDAWDNMEARSEAVDVMTSLPPEIKLAASPSIYVVSAEWTAEGDYGGHAEYSFYAE